MKNAEKTLREEVFRDLDFSPDEVPGAPVSRHGPFTWGATAADAVRTSVILEYVARGERTMDRADSPTTSESEDDGSGGHESTLPRAVLWDLDGTLADSRDYHWLSWVEAMAAEGLAVTEAQFLGSFGQRNDAILGAWLGPGADPARIRRIGEDKEARYRDRVRRSGITPLPGAAEWVVSLHKAGWRQAIASSAPRLNVEVMHEALGFRGLIEVLVAAEDVSMGKPDPEVFLTAARRLGVSPARCVVVEDAEAGIEAARRGGMPSVGVGPGAVEAATVVVPSLAALAPGTFEALLPDF